MNTFKQQVEEAMRQGLTFEDAIESLGLDPIQTRRLKESLKDQVESQTVEDRLDRLQHQIIDRLVSIAECSPNDNAAVAAIRELNAMRSQKVEANSSALELALQRARMARNGGLAENVIPVQMAV